MTRMCRNMICGAMMSPRLKWRLNHQNQNQTLLRDPEVNPGPETGTGKDLEGATQSTLPLTTKMLPLNLSVRQVPAPTRQGRGAEVGGRETGKVPRDLARGIEEGKVDEDTRVPPAVAPDEIGQGRVKRREIGVTLPSLSI